MEKMDKSTGSKVKKYLMVFMILAVWTIPIILGVDKVSAISNSPVVNKVKEIGGNIVDGINDKINALTKRVDKQDTQLNKIESKLDKVLDTTGAQSDKLKEQQKTIDSLNKNIKLQDKELTQLQAQVAKLKHVDGSHSALYLWEDNLHVITEKEMLSLLVWSNFDITPDTRNEHVYFVSVKKDHKLIPRPLPAINTILKKNPDLLIAYPLLNKFVCKNCGNNNGYPWVWEIIS